MGSTQGKACEKAFTDGLTTPDEIVDFLVEILMLLEMARKLDPNFVITPTTVVDSSKTIIHEMVSGGSGDKAHRKIDSMYDDLGDMLTGFTSNLYSIQFKSEAELRSKVRDMLSSSKPVSRV